MRKTKDKKRKIMQQNVDIQVVYSARSLYSAQWALNHCRNFKGEVRWLNANCESEFVLKYSLRNIMARELGIDPIPSDFAILLKQMRAKIADLTVRHKWLFVFDQVNEIRLVNDYIKVLDTKSSLVLTSNAQMKKKLSDHEKEVSLNKKRASISVLDLDLDLEDTGANALKLDEEEAVLMNWLHSFEQSYVSHSILTTIFQNVNPTTLESLVVKDYVSKVTIYGEVYIKLAQSKVKYQFTKLSF